MDNWEADGLQWTLCSGDYNYDDHHLFSGHCAVYRWSPVQGRKGRFRTDILGPGMGFRQPDYRRAQFSLSLSWALGTLTLLMDPHHMTTTQMIKRSNVSLYDSK